MFEQGVFVVDSVEFVAYSRDVITRREEHTTRETEMEKYKGESEKFILFYLYRYNIWGNNEI